MREIYVLGVVSLSMPIFTDSRQTRTGENGKCRFSITVPEANHGVRIAIWKYAESLCSASSVSLSRQETAPAHWGIH